MKKTIFVLLILTAIRCQQSPPTEVPLIATSIYPVYNWTTVLTGDTVSTVNILPPNANPHHFEPTPGLIAQLQSIQLFIGIDPNLDGWVESMLPASAQVVYLSRIFHEHHANPHYWLSVKNTIKMLQPLAESLIEACPEKADSIRYRKACYQKQLVELDQTIQGLFETIENRTFFQWHPAWNYLARDYNLTIAGTLSHGHGDTPSIKKMAALIQLAKSRKIQIIVQGLHEQQQVARTFAVETGSQLLALDTIGRPDNLETNTYIKLMRHNAGLLAQALQSQ